ncbi:hypothetical protein HWV62_32196 [Athelia sp. TMB]|nr:hypothetical protein HWV62_32196 [Athelia sp. TMB]
MGGNHSLMIIHVLILVWQSINVADNPHLRAIFLMLRQELRQEDIPHHTTLRNHIIQIWEEYLNKLSEEMKVCLIF